MATAGSARSTLVARADALRSRLAAVLLIRAAASVRSRAASRSLGGVAASFVRLARIVGAGLNFVSSSDVHSHGHESIGGESKSKESNEKDDGILHDGRGWRMIKLGVDLQKRK